MAYRAAEAGEASAPRIGKVLEAIKKLWKSPLFWFALVLYAIAVLLGTIGTILVATWLHSTALLIGVTVVSIILGATASALLVTAGALVARELRMKKRSALTFA